MAENHAETCAIAVHPNTGFVDTAVVNSAQSGTTHNGAAAAPFAAFAEKDEVATTAAIRASTSDIPNYAEVEEVENRGGALGGVGKLPYEYAEVEDGGPMYAQTGPHTRVDQLSNATPTNDGLGDLVRHRTPGPVVPLGLSNRVSIVDAPDYDTVQQDLPTHDPVMNYDTVEQDLSRSLPSDPGSAGSAGIQDGDSTTPPSSRPPTLQRGSAPPEYVCPPTSMEANGTYSGAAPIAPQNPLTVNLDTENYVVIADASTK
jgi:hypothetical protein